MTDISELAQLAATQEPWQLIYADEWLLVVNKPAKLLTVPGRHPANHDCLISRVQQEFPSAQVVHRLDYDTSGLVILPLTKAALSHISIQFQQRTTEKVYQALVSGEIATQGTVDRAIAADPEHRPLYKICSKGKPSVTHFTRMAFDANNNVSRVRLLPVTGRSHQLRVHMASLGHAILGDEFYAPPEVVSASSRLCLHATTIKFLHPMSQKTLEFSVDPAF